MQTPEELNTRLRLAALELLESQGYESTTAEEIAVAGGISRRSFFRHFPVREDVLFSDHAAYLLRTEARLRVARGEPIREAGDALGMVLDELMSDGEFVARRAKLVRTTASLREREVLWMHQYQELLSGYLERNPLGARNAIFAQIVAAAVLAALGQVIVRWLDAPTTEDPKALFAELVDEIAESMGDSGIRGRGPGPSHPERAGVIVINSGLSAERIAHLIETAQP